MATQKQLEAAKLWRTAEGKALTKDGRKPTKREADEAKTKLAEGVAYGDLAIQLQPSLRRTLQAYYNDTPQVADSFTTEWLFEAINVDEEYNLYKFNQDNLTGKLGESFIPGGLPRLLPGEPYPQIGLQASGKKGRVGKAGESFGTYWETLVNTRGQAVDLIRDSLREFGTAAGNENEIQVAKLLVKAGGFATATGEGLNGAVALTGNPDLTDPVEMAAAIAQLQGLTIEGVEQQFSKFVVVTTVANAPAIRQGVAGRRIIRNPGVEAGYSWEETVDFGAEVEVVGFSWLKAIWPGIGKGAVIIPVAGAGQLPVLTRNRLRGYEEPSLWVKDSNARQLGGGTVDPTEEGDFDSDAVWTKVRHVNGASSLWNGSIGYTTGAGA